MSKHDEVTRESECYIWESLDLGEPPKAPLELADKWESEIYGDRDGQGKRFWVGSLYILAGDIDAAISYYCRYNKDYPGAANTPEHDLTHLLANIRSKKGLIKFIPFDGDISRLMRVLYISNPYIFARLFNTGTFEEKYHHGVNTQKPDWAYYLPDWLFALWKQEEVQLINTHYKDVEFQSFISAWDNLHVKLQQFGLSDERSTILRRIDTYRDMLI